MAQTLTLRAISLGSAAGLVALAVLAAVTMRFQLMAQSLTDDAAITTVVSEPKEPVVLPPPPEPIIRHRPDAVTTSSVATTEANPLFPPLDFGEAIDLGPPEITQPRWIQRPNGDDFARHYPARALQREREGRVVLDCTVSAAGRLACAVASETPQGWGFGAAAIQISQYFQMSPMLEDGRPAEGGRVRVPISFQLN